MDTRRVVGDAGENATAEWYAHRGYAVLDRNWRVREGEIDLVARRGPTVVFCEVKTRRSDAFGAPAEAVTARKQARIRALATQWLTAHAVRADVVRFDVASVRPDGRGGWDVDVIEAAF
ncbi:MAG TPA: YraN family protein [Acidimicrobiia bacterium]|nr:YraN family protein [Acidimicrobiia bacterium]